MTVHAPIPIPRKVFEDAAPSVCPHIDLRRHQQGLRAGQYVDARLEMAWLFWQGLAAQATRTEFRLEQAHALLTKCEQRFSTYAGQDPIMPTIREFLANVSPSAGACNCGAVVDGRQLRRLQHAARYALDHAVADPLDPWFRQLQEALDD